MPHLAGIESNSHKLRPHVLHKGLHKGTELIVIDLQEEVDVGAHCRLGCIEHALLVGSRLSQGCVAIGQQAVELSHP